MSSEPDQLYILLNEDINCLKDTLALLMEALIDDDYRRAGISALDLKRLIEYIEECRSTR